MRPETPAAARAALAAPLARVAVVLVNYNGWRDAIECIDSVLAQEHPNFHIFIVDNDSCDDSIQHLVDWCASPRAEPTWRRQTGVARYTDGAACGAISSRVVERADGGLPPAEKGCRLTLIRSGGNLGFAGGCNVGIRAAGMENFDYFWFLNADTIVDCRALSELLQRAAEDPRVGIAGSTLRFYDAPDTVHALAGGTLNRRNAVTRHIAEGASLADVPIEGALVERDLAFVCGASMLVSTAFIREVGLMQEDYFLYYEDADWAMRGAGRFRLGFAPKSHVFHKSGAHSSKIMPLFTASYYYANRLRFVGRFLPSRMAAAKRRVFMEMLRHIVRGRWVLVRAAGSTLLSRAGRASRG